MKKLLFSIVILFLVYIGVEYGRQYIQERDAGFQHQIVELETSLNQGLVERDQRIAELESENIKIKKDQEIYTIIAGGDLMFDRGVKARLEKNEKNYNDLFEYIHSYLNEADLVFANLEGSLSGKGADQGSKYSFRFEPAVAPAMALAGFDVVSLANNHILNWGREALCDTTTNLNNVGIGYVGAGCNSDDAEAPYITKLGETRIAFLAYTEFYKGAHATTDRPGLSRYDLDLIKKRSQDLKNNDQADLVMVSMHWGEEYKHRAPDRIVDIAQGLVDAGVDVVIGHHPHVDQEIERYGDGWIVYSLGNFVFDQSWSEETMQGLLAEIKVQNKRVYDIAPVEIQLTDLYQPKIVE